MTKTEYSKGRIRLVLDREEVYPNDPGQGTPALVWVGRECGTYWCVTDTGELVDGEQLSAGELRWLESLRDEVESFLYGEGN